MRTLDTEDARNLDNLGDNDLVSDTSNSSPPADGRSAADETPASDEAPAVEVSVDSSDDAPPVVQDTPPKSTAKGRRISISLRSLGVGSIIVALVAAVGVMTWLYVGEKARLDDQARQAANRTRAEQIALDYAVNAAIMDDKDLGPWKQNLVKGTTPELKDKLTQAATAMEQILLPLQWKSTAKPLAAKVRSQDKGVYNVDAFVSVMTKTVQASDTLQSTATYRITIDSNNAWQITDVGGIDAAVGPH
jgi:Mce-associated membrane protein